MEVDRIGNFRCEIKEYGLREMEPPSKSVCVPLRVLLTDYWNGEAWEDYRQYDMHAEGDIWIGKKDGSTNDKQIEALMKCAGWDGSLAALVDASWKPIPCQVQIEEDNYKDQKRFRISWVNDFNRDPNGGSMSNVAGDKLKALEARFGAPLRALQGNIKRGQQPTNGSRPAAPPPPAPVGAAPGKEIPF